MILTPQQIREAYKRLPAEIQSLVMDIETTDLIANKLKEVGLNEGLVNLADSEILYAMYMLQTLDTAIENIAKLSGRQTSEFSGLKSKLEEKIFSKYKDLKMEATPTQDTHPATVPGETVHEVPHVDGPLSAPAPLTPPPPVVTEEPPKPVRPQYSGGQDPYREPLDEVK